MGLTFHPGDSQWDHGSYARFRRQLARYEGIRDLEKWRKNPFREDEQPTVLFPLLDAGDVHGFISGPQCERMLPRLLAIMECHETEFDPFDLQAFEALIEGMDHCARHGCALTCG